MNQLKLPLSYCSWEKTVFVWLESSKILCGKLDPSLPTLCCVYSTISSIFLVLINFSTCSEQKYNRNTKTQQQEKHSLKKTDIDIHRDIRDIDSFESEIDKNSESRETAIERDRDRESREIDIVRDRDTYI